jgi:hypothetical protein
MPAWAGVSTDAFIAGFGIVELTMATVFALLIGFVVLRKLLSMVF